MPVCEELARTVSYQPVNKAFTHGFVAYFAILVGLVPMYADHLRVTLDNTQRSHQQPQNQKLAIRNLSIQADCDCSHSNDANMITAQH
jgi:hypothetical protein